MHLCVGFFLRVGFFFKCNFFFLSAMRIRIWRGTRCAMHLYLGFFILCVGYFFFKGLDDMWACSWCGFFFFLSAVRIGIWFFFFKGLEALLWATSTLWARSWCGAACSDDDNWNLVWVTLCWRLLTKPRRHCGPALGVGKWNVRWGLEFGAMRVGKQSTQSEFIKISRPNEVKV